MQRHWLVARRDFKQELEFIDQYGIFTGLSFLFTDCGNLRSIQTYYYKRKFE